METHSKDTKSESGFQVEPSVLQFDKQIINVTPPRVEKEPEEIKVSVILPVYNVSPYLQQALDTIRCQTLRDIEIICVDDGSTDNCYDILAKNAQEDARIRILRQKNMHLGIARNNGLALARGKYVIFLDSDDFFCLDMLEKTYAQISKTDADICLFWNYQFDHKTGDTVECRANLNTDSIPKEVFCYKDIPEEIFDITTPCVWTKIFSRSFLENSGLRFPDVINHEDCYYFIISQVKANRITFVDEPLVYYRRNTGTSLIDTLYKAPLDFETIYTSCQEELKSMGIYEEVKRSFVSRTLQSILYALDNIRDFAAFQTVYERVKNTMLEQFEIADKPADYFHPYLQEHYKLAKQIEVMTASQFYTERIHREVKDKERYIQQLWNDIGRLQWEINSIHHSWTYRIGRFFTFIPRALRKSMR